MRKLVGVFCAIGMLGLAGAGCGDDPTATCSGYQNCTTGSGNGKWKACASAGSGAYYITSDGTRFDCASSSNCQSAAQEVITWCTAH